MSQPIPLLIAILATFVVSPACFGQSDLPTALKGDWKCNMEKTIEALKAAGTEKGQIDMMKEMLPGISMEITDEGLITKMDLNGFKDERKATYTIVEKNEDKKWLSVEITLDDQDAKKCELTFVENDLLKMKTDDGSILLFDRVKTQSNE